MTTSYELSLKLKELGVEQENREYYWVELYGGQFVRVRKYQIQGAALKNVLCAALTLGELVRELPEFTSILKLNDRFTIGGASYTTFIHNTSPEEAAGELLAAIKEQELKQKEG